MKHSPEYQAIDPHVEPLFKLHKLSESEIMNKKIPPMRLVSSARDGPLYRMEKWISPYLTSLSQEYLQDEYLRDTPHLTDNLPSVSEILQNDSQDTDYNLFTLDVVQLYPSINPELCKLAIKTAMESSLCLDTNLKTAISAMLDLILSHSYIKYGNKDYRIKDGIPTGGCTSRQEADIFMHWLLFTHVAPNVDYWNELIVLWKRFIDDILGIWRGSESQFRQFLLDLNRLTSPFGIVFDGAQFGKSVTFLDVNVYLNEYNNLQFKLHIKPTDARRYLKTSSFHDPAIFKSVPLSQLLRVMNRNSTDESRNHDITRLKEDLGKSGYTKNQLSIAETKAKHKFENSNTDQHIDTDKPIILSTLYFKNTDKLRDLLHNLSDDIIIVTGDDNVKPILANKRGNNVGDKITRNKDLCSSSAITPRTRPQNQKCNARNCKSCQLISDTFAPVITSSYSHAVPETLNCKSRNVIYIAQCRLCTNSQGSNTGQTQQPLHKRINNHRSDFYNQPHKSALAYHSTQQHGGTLQLENYRFAILQQTRPTNLNRLENLYMAKFRCRTLGLNRSNILAV